MYNHVIETVSLSFAIPMESFFLQTHNTLNASLNNSIEYINLVSYIAQNKMNAYL